MVEGISWLTEKKNLRIFQRMLRESMTNFTRDFPLKKGAQLFICVWSSTFILHLPNIQYLPIYL